MKIKESKMGKIRLVAINIIFVLFFTTIIGLAIQKPILYFTTLIILIGLGITIVLLDHFYVIKDDV